MFKPLLRTIPTLTGNFTLGCHADLFERISSTSWRSYVRDAEMLPLQDSLYKRNLPIALQLNKYEFDIKEYYKYYSSFFYNENYEYDKEYVDNINITEYDNQKCRNTNYEFGCKRSSMGSTGYQFSFFAPFFIDDLDDLPDEFVINIEFSNNVTKSIHIPIGNIDNEIDRNNKNALYIYLKRYLEQMDSRCIFCLPSTKQGTYYGISAHYGGFSQCVDNEFSKIFIKQLSLNEFM